MTRVFSIHIKEQVKQQIKGEVKCHVVEDMLTVNIYSVNGVVFRYTQDNLSWEIAHGLTSEIITERVMKKYRSYINYLYFNKKSVDNRGTI